MAAHEAAIRSFGGSSGLRDATLLDSAVHMPQATWGGEYLHPGLFDMAAAYLFHVALNHPFVDGNKRAAWLATRLFLRLNGYRLKPRRAEAVAFVESIAAGKLRDWREISRWSAKRTKVS